MIPIVQMKGMGDFMDNVELGKRIKEARIAKKMTQSEVVGNFITRNMLSQIESGSASPSIKTLEYIANKLDIPINELIPNEEQPDIVANTGEFTSYEYDMLVTFVKAKKHFIKGEYSESIKLLESLTGSTGKAEDFSNEIMYDEICSLLSVSYYMQTSHPGTDNAVMIAYAKKAIEYSTKGIYASTERKTKSMLLLEELLNKQFNL